VPARLRVTQTKSTISQIARNRATIRALGLHRIGDTVEIPDNPATRGMVRQVRFMVAVEEIPAGGSDAPAAPAHRSTSSEAPAPATSEEKA
jgi:large subunit ribosomal protein L30